MIIKILGILDIIIGFMFWLFGVFHIESLSGFFLIIGLYLIAKGIVFITGLSFVSGLDIVSGFLIIAAASINMPLWVILIISLFLIQKGVFSLLG